MSKSISESTIGGMRQGAAKDLAEAIRNLPKKEREVFLRALGRDGILDRAALGAQCGPASHNF